MATKKHDQDTPEADVPNPLTTGLPAEDYMTEQEKDPASDPVSPPVEPVKATVLDIPSSAPYPTGGAPEQVEGEPMKPASDTDADPSQPGGQQEE